jgi:hypothetical protein
MYLNDHRAARNLSSKSADIDAALTFQVHNRRQEAIS